MSTYSWIGGSGVFSTPANWLVDGAPAVASPGAADDVVIAGAGPFTVSVANASVQSLVVADSDAVLAVGGTLAVAYFPTGSYVGDDYISQNSLDNAGTIKVGLGGLLSMGGAGDMRAIFVNTGTIQSQGSVLLRATTMTSALGSITGSSLALDLALDNRDATFDPANYGSGASVAGIITGGTLVADFSPFPFLGTGPVLGSITLDGVTVDGPLSPYNANITLAGSVTLHGTDGTGPGSLFVSGGSLTVTDVPVLDNITIELGGFVIGRMVVATDLVLGAGAVLSADGLPGLAASVTGSGTLTNWGSIPLHGAMNMKTSGFVNDGLIAVGTIAEYPPAAPARFVPGLMTFDTGNGLVTNDGVVLAGGGSVFFRGPLLGDGTIAVSANGTIAGSIEMAGFYDRQLFAFLDDSASVLKFDAPSGINAVLGFRPGNTIELIGTPATVSFANTTLEIRSGANIIAGFVLPDVPAGTQFLATTDANFNTFITELACFAADTRLATASGTAAVEALRPGDLLRTAAGPLAPILWIGRRQIDCRAHPRPWDACPIRIAPHAFGPGQPSRPLRLSPDHAIAFRGTLIPVRNLVNGRTVVQEPPCQITYFHVELPRHALLLAENLACESYLDTGNRAAFATPPPATPGDPTPCAPLVLAGPTLHAARRHLLRRAAALGHRTTRDPDLRLTAAGRPLCPESDGSRWHLRLPPGAGAIRLHSRAFIPAHMRPAENDTRPLGVALANITLDGRPLPLGDPRLSSGWHEPEPAWRWTDGDAGIALAGATTLAFDIVMTGTYWTDARTGPLPPLC